MMLISKHRNSSQKIKININKDRDIEFNIANVKEKDSTTEAF
jgi:hypothetical protein